MIRSLDGVSPRVHPDAFVSEAAYVIGDVEIGAGSSVWPGAVVRADNGSITIGANTCVQDNSVVHGDDDVVIGRQRGHRPQGALPRPQGGRPGARRQRGHGQ